LSQLSSIVAHSVLPSQQRHDDERSSATQSASDSPRGTADAEQQVGTNDPVDVDYFELQLRTVF
jgi:hypothetical protein